MKTGFTSRKDLSVPANRTEAQGLGTNEDGKIGAYGATGRSGVSCARSVNGAIQYFPFESTRRSFPWGRRSERPCCQFFPP